MRDRKRWFNEARLHIDLLEDRLQPGSLLVPGIDIIASNEVTSAQAADSDFTRFLPLRKTSGLADIGVLPPKLETGIEITEQTLIPPSRESQNGSLESALPASKPLGLVRPGISAAMQPKAPTALAASAETRADPQRPIRTVRPELRKAPVEAHRIEPVSHDATTGNLKVTPFDASRISTFQIEGQGAKSAVWQSYTDFGATAARTNAIAAGRAGNINETFVGGSMGDDGAVINIDSLGTTSIGITIDNATSQVTVTDLATNADSLIVVGNDSATTAFALRFNPDDLSFITGFYYSVAGGSVQLEGAANSLNGSDPDVFVTGTLNDPVLNGHDNLFVGRYRPDLLTPVYEAYVDFSNSSHGFAISADRPENAYIGGNADYGGPIRPVTLRLNPGGTVQWAYYLHYGNESFANPTNGVFGVTFLGGLSAAGGIYTVGNLQSDILNPPGPEPSYQNTVIARWNAALGTPLVYGEVWYVEGLNNTGTDSAVDRDGNLYKSGTTGDSLDSDAYVDKYDPTGQNVLGTDYVGGVGTQETGNAIDLYVNLSTANVALGGNANGAISHYTPTGPDATYNGGSDGFAAKLMQPLFP